MVKVKNDVQESILGLDKETDRIMESNYWDEFEYSKLKLLLNINKVNSILEVAKGKRISDKLFPISVELHLTDICNLNCGWCTDKELRKNKATLPIEIIEKLFKEFGEHHTGVTLEGGGEPTLHPQFKEIVDISNHFGVDLGLITNGTVDISESVHKLKWIRISLDSSNEEEYKAEKGVDAFGKVIENLKRMSTMRNPQKTFIGVGYVLTKRNQSNLEVLVKTLDEIGIDYLYFRPVEEAPDIMPTVEEMLDLRKKLVDLTKETRLKYMITIADRVIEKNGNLPCIAHSLTSIIHANGDVSLCEKRRNENVILGNVKNASFREIWESTYREQMTQRLLNSECQQGCSACRITGFNMMFDRLDKLNTKHFI